jgi:hypothetical protein
MCFDKATFPKGIIRSYEKLSLSIPSGTIPPPVEYISLLQRLFVGG